MQRIMVFILFIVAPQIAYGSIPVEKENSPFKTVLEYLLDTDTNQLASIDQFKELFLEHYGDLFDEQSSSQEQEEKLVHPELGPIRSPGKKVKDVRTARALDEYINRETNVPRHVKVALYQIENKRNHRKKERTLTSKQAEHERELRRKLLVNERIQYKQKRRLERLNKKQKNRHTNLDKQDRARERAYRVKKNRALELAKRREAQKRKENLGEHNRLKKEAEKNREEQRIAWEKKQALLNVNNNA